MLIADLEIIEKYEERVVSKTQTPTFRQAFFFLTAFPEVCICVTSGVSCVLAGWLSRSAIHTPKGLWVRSLLRAHTGGNQRKLLTLTFLSLKISAHIPGGGLNTFLQGELLLWSNSERTDLLNLFMFCQTGCSTSPPVCSE